MKIIGEKILEQCLDGTSVYEFLLEAPVSRDLIFFLKQFGEIEYYSTFARPFFRMVHPLKFTLKGVEGMNAVQLVTSQDPDASVNNLRSILAEFTLTKG